MGKLLLGNRWLYSTGFKCLSGWMLSCVSRYLAGFSFLRCLSCRKGLALRTTAGFSVQPSISGSRRWAPTTSATTPLFQIHGSTDSLIIRRGALSRRSWHASTKAAVHLQPGFRCQLGNLSRDGISAGRGQRNSFAPTNIFVGFVMPQHNNRILV